MRKDAMPDDRRLSRNGNSHRDILRAKRTARRTPCVSREKDARLPSAIPTRVSLVTARICRARNNIDTARIRLGGDCKSIRELFFAHLGCVPKTSDRYPYMRTDATTSSARTVMSRKASRVTIAHNDARSVRRGDLRKCRENFSFLSATAVVRDIIRQQINALSSLFPYVRSTRDGGLTYGLPISLFAATKASQSHGTHLGRFEELCIVEFGACLLVRLWQGERETEGGRELLAHIPLFLLLRRVAQGLRELQGLQGYPFRF